MALININSGDINSGDIKEHIAKAVAALKDGYVIIAPLENSYALVADAFFHDAVRAMHVLRDDRLGIAAQVMVASAQSIDGIAREISSDARALMAEFWPGLLSLNLKPQLGLNWDLGDARALDVISVRIPDQGFLHQVISATGPVAVASAAKAGKPAIYDPHDLKFSDLEVAAIFSAGVLIPGPASTIVTFESGKPAVLRVGAISLEQITAITPDI